MRNCFYDLNLTPKSVDTPYKFNKDTNTQNKLIYSEKNALIDLSMNEMLSPCKFVVNN